MLPSERGHGFSRISVLPMTDASVGRRHHPVIKPQVPFPPVVLGDCGGRGIRRPSNVPGGPGARPYGELRASPRGWLPTGPYSTKRTTAQPHPRPDWQLPAKPDPQHIENSMCLTWPSRPDTPQNHISGLPHQPKSRHPAAPQPVPCTHPLQTRPAGLTANTMPRRLLPINPAAPPRRESRCRSVGTATPPWQMWTC